MSSPVARTEQVEAGGEVFAYIVRADAGETATRFLTPPECSFQLGFVVRPAGDAVRPHAHRLVERRLETTAELLLVRTGSCELDLYDSERRLVATRRLDAGDAVLLVAGGHGLRLLEDTVLLEVKQGPYAGQDDKECF